MGNDISISFVKPTKYIINIYLHMWNRKLFNSISRNISRYRTPKHPHIFFRKENFVSFHSRLGTRIRIQDPQNRQIQIRKRKTLNFRLLLVSTFISFWQKKLTYNIPDIIYRYSTLCPGGHNLLYLPLEKSILCLCWPMLSVCIWTQHTFTWYNFCQNEILCITTFHVKSIRDFLEFPWKYFISFPV